LLCFCFAIENANQNAATVITVNITEKIRIISPAIDAAILFFPHFILIAQPQLSSVFSNELPQCMKLSFYEAKINNNQKRKNRSESLLTVMSARFLVQIF
jgi:hypothetical protein